MPHVIVKMIPGRSETQKQALTDAITKSVMEIAVCPEAAVSVAIEDVEEAHWTQKVYKPDIAAHWDKLYREPGYSPD
jgi:4-oxalocrotonate tautomerase